MAPADLIFLARGMAFSSVLSGAFLTGETKTRIRNAVHPWCMRMVVSSLGWNRGEATENRCAGQGAGSGSHPPPPSPWGCGKWLILRGELGTVNQVLPSSVPRSETRGLAAKRKALFGPGGNRADRAFPAFRLGVLRSRFKQIRRGARYEGHEVGKPRQPG